MVTGKVFQESTNIYQDQARVLFDYYKAAAEKIVAEEEACEKLQEDLQQNIGEATATAEAERKKMPIFLGAAGGCALIGLILCFVQVPVAVLLLIAAGVCACFWFSAKNKIGNAEAVITDCREKSQSVAQRYQNIRRDYAVTQLGVAYVPVATRVPFDRKSFMIDHTGEVRDTKFKLTLLHNPEEFQDSVENLRAAMEKMPVAESSAAPETVNTSEYSLSVQSVTLHDYSGNIDRQVRNVSYLLRDNEQVSVDIPVIAPESREAAFISEYATTETGNKPIVPVFDTDFDEKLDKFNQIYSSKSQFKSGEGQDGTDYLRQLMGQLAGAVQTLSTSKNSSVNNLIDYYNNIFATVLKAGYNQYSPALEEEEIERIRAASFDYQESVTNYTPFMLKKSSGVKFDIFSGNWVAEDGSRTKMPFGMHQIDEEIFQPMIQSLMEENREERMHIYADIENQKRDYLDRWSSEVGNYFRDNRAACDELINRIREACADCTAAFSVYRSLQDTSKMMKTSGSLADAEVLEKDTDEEMIAQFEEQSRICEEQQEQFTEYMERVQDDINAMTNEFAHIQYYEGFLRDGLSHDVAAAMGNVRNLDYRHRQLLNVSPYLANYGELPPEPSTTERMEEDISIDLVEQANEVLREIDEERI